MELSRRLQAVADLLGDDMQVVADVGTDHGYIPIYLVQNQKCKKAFAMDVNRGPLERATAHIHAYHLEEQIETRLSDGVAALSVGECDAAIVAGMGGALTIKILTEGEDVFRSLKTFVLQPQSEVYKVREFLLDHGYRVVAEDMVLEDGKFYPMMRVEVGADTYDQAIEFHYGRLLLAEKHPVLRKFLEKELQVKTEIFEHLKDADGEQITNRKKTLYYELRSIRRALEVCK